MKSSCVRTRAAVARLRGAHAHDTTSASELTTSEILPFVGLSTIF